MYKILCITLVSSFLLSSCGTSVPEDKYNELAQCLTEKGVNLYGTFWCPNCTKQKELFGNAVEYLNNIECDPRGENEQSELCLEIGINKYPTWEMPDGSMVVGVHEPEELGEMAGCEVPEEN